MEIQHQSVAHELLDSELTEQNFRRNQELRWMVFKVKQKGQDSYWNKTDIQVGKNLADVRLGKNQENYRSKRVSVHITGLMITYRLLR